MPTFADVGGLRYVTPILAHGGIPDYCLEDFFQYLLLPIVSGRLEVDVSDTEGIVQEWQERSSLFMFTDKPVRRFLLHGGKAATDFLGRCIEMAQRAYEEGEVPTAEELDLPFRVVERFEEWWRSREDRRIERQLRSQFRRPVISLAYEFGEVCFNVPQQKIRTDTELTAVSIEIVAGQDELTKQPIRAYRRSGLIETEEIQIPLHSPAEMYEVRLLGNGKVLWTWSFKGLTKERPWMAFDGATKRMIQREELPCAPVWLVFPKHCSIEPDVRPLEEGQSFYGRWAQYRACLLNLSSVEVLHLLDEGYRVKIPLDSEAASEPELTGGEQIPRVLCEGEPVYGTAPILIIPLSEQMHRWHLSIVPQGKTTLNSRIDYNLANLITGQKIETVFHIPLSDERLLGAHAVGRFLVRLRGPLGKTRQFRFALLPNLKMEFDQALYVPYLEKAPEAKLTLTAESAENIIVEEPCRILEQFGNRWVVKIPETESSIRCSVMLSLSYGQTAEMPLAICVPRLRLAIQGLSGQPTWQWAHTVQEISLEQWEESEEMFLLIDAPCEEGRATLELQNTNQQVRQPIHRGKARFELKRFSDTLKTLEQPLSLFYLNLEWNDESVQVIPVLVVRTEWIVEGLKQTERVKDGRREIHLTWTDRGRVRNRIVRLWNLWRPWQSPLQLDIPDGASNLCIVCTTSYLHPGKYRIEFAVDDPWQNTLSELLPDPDNKRIFDISVGVEDERLALASSILVDSLGSSFLKMLERWTAWYFLLESFEVDITKCSIPDGMVFSDNIEDSELEALAKLMMYWLLERDGGRKLVKILWNNIFLGVKHSDIPNRFSKILNELKGKVKKSIQDKINLLRVIIDIGHLELPFKTGDIIIYNGKMGMYEGIISYKMEKYLKIMYNDCFIYVPIMDYEKIMKSDTQDTELDFIGKKEIVTKRRLITRRRKRR